ncbi:hypothetical protein Y032_0040g261 [Ancylostoma ceylanicum]|uniref:Uncharacterized protein n=1 Tax=Ancylostoma ceylanicum TaxID=53326 RepID=A0A016UGT7_9BILA|nr:hypothetical protein Y032_0040g261 [Ancylostoma ceylanicum]
MIWAQRKTVYHFLRFAIEHRRTTYLESGSPIPYSDMRFTLKTHRHLVSFPRKCATRNAPKQLQTRTSAHFVAVR